MPSRLSLAALAANLAGVALSPTALADDGTPLVVMFGGRFSCTEIADVRAVHAKFVELHAALAEEIGASPAVVEVCFGNGGEEAALRRGLSGSFGPWIDHDAVAREIAAAAGAAGRGTKVFLVGYSYGGWLAMRTALALPAAVEVVGLDTIDPISTVACPTWAYVRGASGLYPIDPGCTQSPPDLAPRGGDIATRVGAWRNFHQPDSPYLHASAIPEATADFELRFSPPPYYTVRAHLDIATGDTAWREILAGMRATLAGE